VDLSTRYFFFGVISEHPEWLRNCILSMAKGAVKQRIEAYPEPVEGGAACPRPCSLSQPAPPSTGGLTGSPRNSGQALIRPPLRPSATPFDKLRTRLRMRFQPTQDASLAFAAVVLVILSWDKARGCFLMAPSPISIGGFDPIRSVRW
jgi:hypothetical protein